MTPIALLRHFPTDWNAEGRLQGRVDRPLTEEAQADLAGLRPPPPWNAAEALTSPLARARETAEALWPGAAVDARLTELDWGAWEGRRGVDLLADPASGYDHVERWGWDRTPPGGESPRDAWERVAPLLAEISERRQPTALVAHRGLIRVVLAVAWGWDFDRPEPFRIRRARLHTLTLNAAGRPCAPGPLLALDRR